MLLKFWKLWFPVRFPVVCSISLWNFIIKGYLDPNYYWASPMNLAPTIKLLTWPLFFQMALIWVGGRLGRAWWLCLKLKIRLSQKLSLHGPNANPFRQWSQWHPDQHPFREPGAEARDALCQGTCSPLVVGFPFPFCSLLIVGIGKALARPLSHWAECPGQLTCMWEPSYVVY